MLEVGANCTCILKPLSVLFIRAECEVAGSNPSPLLTLFRRDTPAVDAKYTHNTIMIALSISIWAWSRWFKPSSNLQLNFKCKSTPRTTLTKNYTWHLYYLFEPKVRSLVQIQQPFSTCSWMPNCSFDGNFNKTYSSQTTPGNVPYLTLTCSVRLSWSIQSTDELSIEPPRNVEQPALSIDRFVRQS